MDEKTQLSANASQVSTKAEADGNENVPDPSSDLETPEKPPSPDIRKERT
jgi:hypothetical protein